MLRLVARGRAPPDIYVRPTTDCFEVILIKPANINCARHVRDGGIDALAALDYALSQVLIDLSPDQERELKLAFGRVMAEITLTIINPAVDTFPNLKPDSATWASIARARAAARS